MCVCVCVLSYTTLFSMHSLRAGRATVAANVGVEGQAIQAAWSLGVRNSQRRLCKRLSGKATGGF